VRVLYFGTYERDYPRNAQVISCLRRAGVEVIELHVDAWKGRRDKWSSGPVTALRLALSELRLLAARRDPFDVMIVGYPGHFDMPVARRVANGKAVVFNPLVSLFDTFVADRSRFSPRSSPARALYRVDRFAFRRADVVVADTQEQARFFSDTFGLSPARVKVCFVGAEDRLFRPRWQLPSVFGVLFVGKLIPLHGLETILEAARLLPEIPFRIVGSGQLDSLLGRPPGNVQRIPWIDYAQLPDEICSAGCVLGIFGTSAKAARVIPNKVFQALACGAPLVTADTSAAGELLTDEREALLVPPGDAKALAAAVRRLADDPDLACSLGAAGRMTYEARASEAALGDQWRTMLEELLAG
jgi:glycosyltransferase involved in cell wall biosynthesis